MRGKQRIRDIASELHTSRFAQHRIPLLDAVELIAAEGQSARG
jgi:hypothetical protein